MVTDYSSTIAKHYRSYRPPLHALILKRCLEMKEYGSGLDFGCGTGQSSHALIPYCNKVVGLEPSEAMLAEVHLHPDIRFILLREAVPLPEKVENIGVITFAGSWFYARSQPLVNELARISKENTLLVFYDFEVQHHNFNQLVTLPSDTSYDYSADLTGLDPLGFVFQKRIREAWEIEINLSDFVHLFLATADTYNALSEKYGQDKLYARMLNEIKLMTEGDSVTLPVNIYASTYLFSMK